MTKKDKIESLSPLEHVRLRPGMYVGNTANANQLLLEAFANALDMHCVGYGNKIEVFKRLDGSWNIRDYGKGFPVNEKREDGLTTLQASYSVINTSGKFSDDGLYEGTSLGLNGIGAKLCNFLSHWCRVETVNNGKYESVYFEEGEIKDTEFKDDVHAESGTIISFLPSEEFFASPIIDEKYFNKFFNDMCCLCPSLEIVFNGKIISHENGLNDLVKENIGNDVELVDSKLLIEDKTSTQSLSLGLTYTDGNSAKIVPYVNYGLTETGPHITSIKTAITKTINSWARENGFLKEKDKNLDGNAVQEGLVLVFNLITKGVGYNAQVKSSIVKIDTSFVGDIFSKQFEKWLDNNPQDASNIVEKALVARKAAEAAKAARKRVKENSLKKDKVFKLPTKLTDCWTKDRSKAEIYITEGLSAASGLVEARDSEFQAVYGVRGKMLSVLKTSPEKILANQEINNLIQALGLECDVKTATLKYDKKKLRYDKIIAACDAN